MLVSKLRASRCPSAPALNDTAPPYHNRPPLTPLRPASIASAHSMPAHPFVHRLLGSHTHAHTWPPSQHTHTHSLSLSHPSLGTTVSSCGAAPLSGLDIKPHRRAPDACMHEDRPRRQRCFTWSRIHTVLCLSTIQLMHRHTPGASIAAAHGRISEIWKFLFWRAGE